MIPTVIVYYSKDNNTRTGANILAEKIGAKVVELKEVKKGNFIQALMQKGTTLTGNPWDEVKHAKRVYLMSPIWASNGVPAMNTFLEKADFKDKEIIIITFQQFKDLRKSEDVHKHFKNIIEMKKGKVLECHALIGGKMGHFAGEDYIRMQMDKI